MGKISDLKAEVDKKDKKINKKRKQLLESKAKALKERVACDFKLSGLEKQCRNKDDAIAKLKQELENKETEYDEKLEAEMSAIEEKEEAKDKEIDMLRQNIF